MSNHSHPHPHAGKTFLIRLRGDVQAGYDVCIDGSPFRLIDWADRIDQNPALVRREVEVALMFYAHRRAPHLEAMDPVPLRLLDLTDVVYGEIQSSYQGKKRLELVLLHSNEIE